MYVRLFVIEKKKNKIPRIFLSLSRSLFFYLYFLFCVYGRYFSLGYHLVHFFFLCILLCVLVEKNVFFLCANFDILKQENNKKRSETVSAEN